MGDRTKGVNVTSPLQRHPDAATAAARLRRDMAATRADIEQTVEEIGQRLTPSAMAAEATDRIRETAANAGRRATVAARDVTDRVVAESRETARQVLSRYRDTAARVRLQSRGAADQIRTTAAEHPALARLATVTIAFGAGAIIYLARARRRRARMQPPWPDRET
jgi:hypothetical protein